MSGWWIIGDTDKEKHHICESATKMDFAIVEKPGDRIVSKTVSDFAVPDLLAVVSAKLWDELDETEDNCFSDFMTRVEDLREDYLKEVKKQCA